jgi:ABC-type branched-subunit amino acid transport system ATPase component
VRDNVIIAALAELRGKFRLDMLRGVHRVPGWTRRCEHTLQLVDLAERGDVPVSQLAYGEKRRLEIGLALASSPSLLLLDEPLAGMSPQERVGDGALLKSIARGRTMIIIDHDMDALFELAERITVLQEGRVLVEGTPAEIKRNARVQEAYLGGVTAECSPHEPARVHGLNSYYGDSHILFDVSLRVERNEVVALLGRNGAGKSTTLKSLMGVVHAARGSVSWAASRSPAARATRSRAPACSSCTRTGASSAASTSRRTWCWPGSPRRERWPLERIYAMFPRLKARRASRGTDLSGGEQQMLAIARALVRDPEIVLLDEPFEGLAPVIVQRSRRRVPRARRGRADDRAGRAEPRGDPGARARASTSSTTGTSCHEGRRPSSRRSPRCCTAISGSEAGRSIHRLPVGWTYNRPEWDIRASCWPRVPLSWRRRRRRDRTSSRARIPTRRSASIS